MPFSEEFDYQEIHCFRYLSEPTQFYYVPGAPTPLIDRSGQPAISLFKTGEKSFLQLTSQWWVDHDQKQALQTYLSHQCNNLDPSEIQLSMAPVVVQEVTLTLNSQGSNARLGVSSSSGYPPYGAAFNAILTENQRGDVEAALAGAADILIVAYKVALQKRVFSETSGTINFSLASAKIRTTQHLTSTISVELERKADISTWSKNISA